MKQQFRINKARIAESKHLERNTDEDAAYISPLTLAVKKELIKEHPTIKVVSCHDSTYAYCNVHDIIHNSAVTFELNFKHSREVAKWLEYWYCGTRDACLPCDIHILPDMTFCILDKNVTDGLH